MTQTKKFLTAEWRYLAMLNYEIEPAVLRPRVPYGTELDTWNGKTFVSLVGFMFLKTRVLGIPIPFHQNFEEVNLRFYVRHKAVDGWRRGVVFIKELVPRWAIATVARVVYNENYEALPMRQRLEVEGGELKPDGAVEYGWRYQGDWNYLRVQTTGAAQSLSAGSEEEFITEHYWGYAAQTDGGCMQYQVEHPPWRVWQVRDHSLHCQVAALYGEPFVAALSSQASSAFLADGSPIIVRQGQRL
ncbi:MAG: DUF2071 domain-containing protein [Acidobacteria bacterium]|nr:DUF2071 domain-containing protein [Acidobacteriota bacterium]